GGPRTIRAVADDRTITFMNRTADKLAKASASQPLRGPVRHTRVRRKTTNKITEPGSIKPQGQDLPVRIVTDNWLRVRPCTCTRAGWGVAPASEQAVTEGLEALFVEVRGPTAASDHGA